MHWGGYVLWAEVHNPYRRVDYYRCCCCCDLDCLTIELKRESPTCLLLVPLVLYERLFCVYLLIALRYVRDVRISPVSPRARPPALTRPSLGHVDLRQEKRHARARSS